MGEIKLDPIGFAAEFLGAFLLTLTISLSEGDPNAVAGSLFLGMCITRFKSGAQFNPAVSLSILTKSLFEKKRNNNQIITLLLNIPSQIIGGLLAGFLGWGVSGRSFYFKYASHISLGQAFLSEMCFTTLLCLNIHQAGKAARGLMLEGGMIALTLGTCAFTIGYMTRNCLNPAVEFGLGTAHYSDHFNGVSKMWLYLAAPVIGGCIAALIARVRRIWDDNPRATKTLTFTLMSV